MLPTTKHVMGNIFTASHTRKLGQVTGWLCGKWGKIYVVHTRKFVLNPSPSWRSGVVCWMRDWCWTVAMVLADLLGPICQSSHDLNTNSFNFWLNSPLILHFSAYEHSHPYSHPHVLWENFSWYWSYSVAIIPHLGSPMPLALVSKSP